MIDKRVHFCAMRKFAWNKFSIIIEIKQNKVWNLSELVFVCMQKIKNMVWQVNNNLFLPECFELEAIKKWHRDGQPTYFLLLNDYTYF